MESEMVVGGVPLINHGTTAGYARHFSYGILPTCRECKDAHNNYNRARYVPHPRPIRIPFTFAQRYAAFMIRREERQMAEIFELQRLRGNTY